MHPKQICSLRERAALFPRALTRFHIKAVIYLWKVLPLLTLTNRRYSKANTIQMVSRAYYESEEPVYSRHGGRRHGYPLSHDRELPTSSGPYSSSRNHQLALQESRASGQASDQESASSLPRRRIPVAVSFSMLKIIHRSCLYQPS